MDFTKRGYDDDGGDEEYEEEEEEEEEEGGEEYEDQNDLPPPNVYEERAHYESLRPRRHPKSFFALGVCAIAIAALCAASFALTKVSHYSADYASVVEHDGEGFLFCDSIKIDYSESSQCDKVISGCSCEFECEYGYSPSGPLICDGHGKWKLPHPICAMECKGSAMPSVAYMDSNSIVECDSVLSGYSCVFKCNYGLVPSAKYDCYDGQWKNTPHCVCPAFNSLFIPGSNPLTTAACEGTPVGSSCEVSCLVGDKIGGDPKCTAEGWVALPKCVAQTTPYIIGYVEGCELTAIDGCCTSWICKDGYSKGIASLRGANEWDVSRASCANYCPLIEEKHITSNCYGTIPGAVCPIECANDLVPVERYAICTHYGWDLPACKCGDPSQLHIPNVDRFGTSCLGLYPGESCAVYCADVSRSVAVLECSKEGDWDRSVCVCEPINLELIPGVDPDTICGPADTPVGGSCAEIDCMVGEVVNPGPARCTVDGWVNLPKCVCASDPRFDGFSKGCEGTEISSCCTSWECNGDMTPSGFISCEADGTWDDYNAKCSCTTFELNNALKFNGVVATNCDIEIGQYCQGGSTHFSCVYPDLTLDIAHYSDAICDINFGWTFVWPPKCGCLGEDIIIVHDPPIIPIDCDLELGQSCVTFSCLPETIDNLNPPRIDCTKTGWAIVVPPQCVKKLNRCTCPPFGELTDEVLLKNNINGHGTEFPECWELSALECCNVPCFSMSHGYEDINKVVIEKCIPCGRDGEWELTRTSGCLCKPSDVMAGLPPPCICTDACSIFAVDSEFVFGEPKDCKFWCNETLGFEMCYGHATTAKGVTSGLRSPPGNCQNIGTFDLSCALDIDQGACVCGAAQPDCPNISSRLSDPLKYNIKAGTFDGCTSMPFLGSCEVMCESVDQIFEVFCGPDGYWLLDAACTCAPKFIRYLPLNLRQEGSFYFPLIDGNDQTCEELCGVLGFNCCRGRISGTGQACWGLNTFVDDECGVDHTGACVCSDTQCPG